MEFWKEIKGYEGLYEVSNLGNVKSLNRYVNNNGGFRKINEKILKPSIARDGYYIVILCSVKRKTYKVHQLVAMSFLNHIPNRYKIVIDHINNNPLDNRVENLQLITQRENCLKDKKNKSSQYQGVCWDKNAKKWMSTIMVNKKQINLGLFIDESEANEYYQKAIKSINDGTEIIIKKAVFSSKYKGVTYIKEDCKWRASIIFKGKRINVGRFNTEYEAFLEREKKIKELY